MAGLIFKNVNKSFKKDKGKIDVLKDISFTIKDREFVVLVGPSGSGKSTLLRLIAGLDNLTSGSIFIGDKDVTNLESTERNISMVFQSYALYPHMNVYDNMGFGLKMQGKPKAEIKRRVAKAASILGLEELLYRKPKTLSGGQKQRVAIGRSIVREPKVFLLDEPLSNLDAELRVQTRIEIAKLHNELNSTMVYVTHDQIEAMTMADKIAIMNDGYIQQFDTPLEIYKNPCNLFTARFIGSPSMNFIDVIVHEKNNKLFINLINDNETVYPIYLGDNFKNLDKYVGKTVIAGLRPEYIQNGFRDQMIKDELQDIEAKIDIQELTGSDVFLHITLNKTNIISRVSPSGAKANGETIGLKIWTKKILLFDKESKNRII
jgi:multiple sugar transport system ATP-binding protein